MGLNFAKLSKRRRWLLAAGIAFTCGLGVSVLVGSVLTAPRPAQIDSLPYSYGSEDVTIASASGSQLAGWYIETPQATGTVVLLPPLGGQRRSMLRRLDLMTDAGFSVLAIDFQASGMSPGKAITMGHLESLDAEAAVAFARQREPNHKIAVLGWSLGGAATLLAEDLQADAVILECVYTSITAAIDNRVAEHVGFFSPLVTPLLTMQLPLRLGVGAGALRPIDHIADLGCPVLILGGGADPYTPPDETRALFDAAREPKQLVLIEGAPHLDLQKHNPAQYESVVTDFLNQTMGQDVHTGDLDPGSSYK